MKFLVLFGVLLCAYLIWRHQRALERSERPAPPPPLRGRPPSGPQDMVPCAVCQVHVPRGEAVLDARGRIYCCAEHRSQGQGSV